jgi:hypothetical protein
MLKIILLSPQQAATRLKYSFVGRACRLYSSEYTGVASTIAAADPAGPIVA